MRLGVNIEYEGKSYDILELPVEAFMQLVPGLTAEQFRQIEEEFEPFWPERTLRRNHILAFAAEQLGTSVDYLLMNRQNIQFTQQDLLRYIEEQFPKGYFPS